MWRPGRLHVCAPAACVTPRAGRALSRLNRQKPPGQTQEVTGEMKRIGSVVLCFIGVAAIGGSVALADNATNPNWVAAHQCTTELHAMGVKNFKALYGDSAPKYQHAMRNCQREHGKSAENVINNAAQQCKAEQIGRASCRER